MRDRYIILAFASHFPQEKKKQRKILATFRGRSGSPLIWSWKAKCRAKLKLCARCLGATARTLFSICFALTVGRHQRRVWNPKQKRVFYLLLSILLFQMWVSANRKREKRSGILTLDKLARRMRISCRLMAIEK